MRNGIRQLFRVSKMFFVSKCVRVWRQKSCRPNAKLIQWFFSWHYLDKFRNQDADVKSFHLLVRLRRLHRAHTRTLEVLPNDTSLIAGSIAMWDLVRMKMCSQFKWIIFLCPFPITGAFVRSRPLPSDAGAPHTHTFSAFKSFRFIRKMVLLNCNYNCAPKRHRLRARCQRLRLCVSCLLKF